MKNKRLSLIAMALMVVLALGACSKTVNPVDMDKFSEPGTGEIYLYGEMHSDEKILEKQLELWDEYYHKENMRHFFVESAYYTGEFLNLWMESDNDEIFEEVYADWEGSQAHSLYVKDFYKKLKNNYPETIFHGTDVGHQYNTTGERFLKYLEENNLEDSEKYSLTQEAIEQGKYFYENEDSGYRENKMVENFIREFDKLEDENIMGVYGGAHTGIKGIAHDTKSLPSMANQLEKRYGDAIYSQDLSEYAKDMEALRVDKITINEKEYEALYFGEMDLEGFKGYSHREYWRLENAYEDFKSHKKNTNVLPYDNYPMKIETGQVFVIDYTKTNGSVRREYYRSDGTIWQDQPATEEFIVK